MANSSTNSKLLSQEPEFEIIGQAMTGEDGQVRIVWFNEDEKDPVYE